MTTPCEQPDFRDVRKVQAVGPTADRHNPSKQVNEALSLGWVLLRVCDGPVFVLGWTKDGEAPETSFDKPPVWMRKKERAPDDEG
jgi:hypothetical protein